ncbi:unnamed protein product, partial [Mesorhabditis spiculigera]
METPTTTTTALTTPAHSSLELDGMASTSTVEEIVKSVLSLHKNSLANMRSTARHSNATSNGYARCHQCSRLLSTTSGSLISHAISHYPVKRFGCPHCGSQFFKKSMYLDHVKSAHPDEKAIEPVDLRTENRDPANDAIRSEWRRVALECFPSHSHLFKSAKTPT